RGGFQLVAQSPPRSLGESHACVVLRANDDVGPLGHVVDSPVLAHAFAFLCTLRHLCRGYSFILCSHQSPILSGCLLDSVRCRGAFSCPAKIREWRRAAFRLSRNSQPSRGDIVTTTVR